jgi:CBS domain-containing protein
MGTQEVASGATQSRMREFTRAVLEDLDGLEQMIRDERFEKGVRRIGAEQEMFLVDSARQPAPIAMELLEALRHDPRVTTELARFNLEANLSPQVFGESCLRRMEEELKAIIEMVDAAAQTLGGGVALTGILPTLRLAHLTLENMTPNPRYFELNNAISAVNDGAFSIVIKGLDELDITHDNVLMEAANTSFQVHFQVAPHEFAPLYNLAQAISAPVLAAAVNSPLMLGQRLWHETRVALFQRSVDARSTAHKMRAKPTRVSFGDSWIRESILEIYKDDIARFRVMLSTDVDENPLKVLRDGGVPELRALRMHTSTVWRWNRACYGVHNGKPHLRIENRILPAGPTVIDEVANAAFFFGLMASMADEYPRIDHVMSFDDAKSNFFAAARHGLNAQFTWIGGKTRTAHDLIIDELLPNARKGLSTHGIDPADIDRYLGVIEERVRSQCTGSQWALRSLATMHDAPLDVRMRSLVSAIAKHQRAGQPVHTWPLATLYRTRDWFPSYRTVGQFMSTDIYTVRPSDPIDLVARMMEWQQVRHVPVEDDHGRLVGLVSFRDLLRLIGNPEDRPDTVEEIMRKEPLSVRTNTPTLEALTIMREKNIGSLPVVDEDNRLIGLVTVYDLLGIAAKVLEDFLRGEAESKPGGRNGSPDSMGTPPTED